MFLLRCQIRTDRQGAWNYPQATAEVWTYNKNTTFVVKICRLFLCKLKVHFEAIKKDNQSSDTIRHSWEWIRINNVFAFLYFCLIDMHVCFIVDLNPKILYWNSIYNVATDLWYNQLDYNRKRISISTLHEVLNFSLNVTKAFQKSHKLKVNVYCTLLTILQN